MGRTTSVAMISLLLVQVLSAFTSPGVGALMYNMDSSLSNADAIINGKNDIDHLGWAVRVVGDVNGDGLDDILVSGPWNDEGGHDSGKVYLFFGNDTGLTGPLSTDDADASFIGHVSDSRTGRYLDGGCDIDDDGYDDLFIYHEAPFVNTLHVIYGKASGWTQDLNLTNSDTKIQHGYRMTVAACAGDVDADGYQDLLIGSYFDGSGGNLAGKVMLRYGNGQRLGSTYQTSNMDASWRGMAAGDYAGYTVDGAGDVNGDGYDDIILGAQFNDDNGTDSGRAYLIFGRSDRYDTHGTVSTANVFLTPERLDGRLGTTTTGVGDMNGDGLDDVMVGAHRDSYGLTLSGQVYLVLGRSGWSTYLNMTDADASYYGEGTADLLGINGARAGDVDGDGLQDMIFGSYNNNEVASNAGQTYLVLGRTSGWSMHGSAGTVDASFRGEVSGDMSGFSVSGGGDINGDGLDDIIIGATEAPAGGTLRGRAYVVFPDSNTRPTVVNSVKAFTAPDFSTELFSVQINDTVYVELVGTDGDPSRADLTEVTVNSSATDTEGFVLKLIETGVSSGKYRGHFHVKDITHESHKWIGTASGEEITVASVQEPSKRTVIGVNIPIQLRPLEDVTTAMEDQEYRVTYWGVGTAAVSEWVIESNASWMTWSGDQGLDQQDVWGTPNNTHVGSCWIRVHISDGQGHSDERNFTVNVSNAQPNILTDDVTETPQGVLYNVSYEADDEGQGDTSWNLTTDADFLLIDEATGDLTGIPDNDDVGQWSVTVRFFDGNGGSDSSTFALTVDNTNDPPTITTTDITVATEDVAYNVSYSAIDVDVGDALSWALTSNATWLDMDTRSALLYGIPTNKDVGEYWVNVTVKDASGATDHHNFTLTVKNVNDAPVITSTPITEAISPFRYRYRVVAEDVDKDDVLWYRVETGPKGMTINKTTGVITWVPGADQTGTHDIIVRAQDDLTWDEQAFRITVVSAAPVPVAPNDGADIVGGPELVWTFIGNGTEGIVFDIYLGATDPPADLLVSGHNTTKFRVNTTLAENTVHYWRVVPRNGDVVGRSSEVWSFRAIPGFTPDYDVRLDLSTQDLKLSPGESGTIQLTIYNHGNVNGTITILAQTELPDDALVYPSETFIEPDSSSTVTLRLDVRKGQPYGMYEVTIIVGHGNATDTKVLTVAITKKASPPTQLALWEEPLFWAIFLLIVVVAMVGLGYSYHRRRQAEAALKAAELKATEVEDFEIDEVFLIYSDGRLITHISNLEAKVDQDIFAGMLVAIQTFVRESFATEEGLKSFEFGSRKMVLEKGRHVILAVALSGTEPDILEGQMHELIQKIEGLYAGRIEDWDGSMDHLANINHYLVPLFGIKKGLRIKKEKEEVKVKSAIEFFGGYVRLKVAVANALSSKIKDIEMDISFDDRTLRLSHVQPDYPMRGRRIYLDPITPGEKRTIAFYLDPLICQESHIDVKVTFKDEYGNAGITEMKRRPVDIVCPIFYTPENINVAMLKRLLGEHSYSDNRIYTLPPELGYEQAFEMAKGAIQRHDIRFVREFKVPELFAAEAWYYGRTTESEEEMILKLSVRGDMHTLEILVSCNNLATQTGLLAEVGNNIYISFGDKGLGLPRPSTDQGLKEQLAKLELLLDRGK